LPNVCFYGHIWQLIVVFNTYTTLFSLQLAFIIDVIVAGVVANLPFTVLVTGAFFCDGGLLNVEGVGFVQKWVQNGCNFEM